jgi:Arc/MetJ family transcription regulator
MRTNIEIDPELMAEVMQAFGVNTKREAVDRALREALVIERQKAALNGLWGLGWDGDLDAMRTEKPLEWG